MTDNDQMRILDARNSFTGKALTASQFDESWALAGIMHRSIQKSGSFIERLTDYSRAFADAENFDQMKGEVIIRDIFKSRYGETMNHMREGLMEREKIMADSSHDGALHHAKSISDMIKDGDTMPFYRAYDHVAVQMAEQHNITESGAKTMMKDAFAKAEGRELYDASKEVEKEFHAPVREERQAKRVQSKPRSLTRHM